MASEKKTFSDADIVELAAYRASDQFGGLYHDLLQELASQIRRLVVERNKEELRAYEGTHNTGGTGSGPCLDAGVPSEGGC